MTPINGHDAGDAIEVLSRQVPWTEHQLRQITGYVTAGVTVPVACEAAGVKWTTGTNWMQRGKMGIAPYTEFRDAMLKAKAMHEAGLLLIIANEAKRGIPGSSWKAAAWLYERRQYLSMRQRGERGLPGGAEPEATVLMYPVPVPEGADLSGFALTPEAHAAQQAPEDDPFDEEDP